MIFSHLFGNKFILTEDKSNYYKFGQKTILSLGSSIKI